MIDFLENGKRTTRFPALSRLTRRINKFTKNSKSFEYYKVLNAIGRVWHENFRSEGKMAGGWGWQMLGPSTQRVREWRGYSPKHPILRQTGGLYNMAVTFPMKFQGKSGSASRERVSISVRTGRTILVAEISGWKVQNQHGATGEVGRGLGYRPGPREWYMPARPFWFVNSDVTKAAGDAMRDMVKDEWEKSRK